MKLTKIVEHHELMSKYLLCFNPGEGFSFYLGWLDHNTEFHHGGQIVRVSHGGFENITKKPGPSICNDVAIIGCDPTPGWNLFDVWGQQFAEFSQSP